MLQICGDGVWNGYIAFSIFFFCSVTVGFIRSQHKLGSDSDRLSSGFNPSVMDGFSSAIDGDLARLASLREATLWQHGFGFCRYLCFSGLALGFESGPYWLFSVRPGRRSLPPAQRRPT